MLVVMGLPGMGAAVKFLRGPGRRVLNIPWSSRQPPSCAPSSAGSPPAPGGGSAARLVALASRAAVLAAAPLVGVVPLAIILAVVPFKIAAAGSILVRCCRPTAPEEPGARVRPPPGRDSAAFRSGLPPFAIPGSIPRAGAAAAAAGPPRARSARLSPADVGDGRRQKSGARPASEHRARAQGVANILSPRSAGCRATGAIAHRHEHRSGANARRRPVTR